MCCNVWLLLGAAEVEGAGRGVEAEAAAELGQGQELKPPVCP